MKKTILILMGVLAAAAFADRTANRDWVGQNFAPSNLVPRVEALENAEPPVETDPVFGAWKVDNAIEIGSGASVDEGHGVSIGQDSYSLCDSIAIGANAKSEGCESIAIGKSSAATDDNSLAIGRGAVSYGANAVQIGAGVNATAGTLQFRSWPLVDSDGKIPKERLSAMDETDPTFTAWTNGEAVAVGESAVAARFGAVGIGAYARAKSSYSVAIGGESMATAEYAVQLGAGCNSTYGSLQFGEWTLLDEFGKIPADRLPSGGTSIPRTSEEEIPVGPLVLGQDTVYIAPGVFNIKGAAWKRSNWELDSCAVYTTANWNFSDGWERIIGIGPDGICIYGDNHLTFANGTQFVSFDDKVKSVITPAVVLEKIKAMNDTQKAELKAFLGIE